MKQAVQHATNVDGARLDPAVLASLLRAYAEILRLGFRSALLLSSLATILLCSRFPVLHAQQPDPTGPQQLTFAGLRAGPALYAQINAIQVSAQGNLYLLLNQQDGVRILETDASAANVLAQIQIGAPGDIGLAMALDPSGNVCVTGTTTSGAMAATPGAAFTSISGSSVNSFIAKFDPSLNPIFVTFAGGSSLAAASIAATSDAIFIAGQAFAATVPVTSAGIIQAPAYGSMQNGFVERFSADGSSLVYATYLSGAAGSTTPTAIAADTSDDAYIAGTTTSAGYPTTAALVPEMLGTTSGFLTKLTPAGDGLSFSTYLPGAGIGSLALDPVAGNLLLSGSISLGQFPVATVTTPLTATTYQTLLRLPLDGSTVLFSTLLAPGTQSFAAPDHSGGAWVTGSLSLPLLPLTPLAPFGQSFAVHVNSAGAVDQTARFGGVATSNPGNAGAPVTLTSLAVDSSGAALLAGSFAPWASGTLLSTETYDLPLTSATTAFPSAVRTAVPSTSACGGSLCSGIAAYLARLSADTSTASATASLALSVDDSPNLTLRNLGSAQATGLTLAVTGFTYASNCGATLPAGQECSVSLAGAGPGLVTASAVNASSQTQTLPALTSSASPLAVVFSPKELDFGIISSASGAVTQTITVTNLTQQSQTFSSALDTSAQTTLPYTLAETASDCAVAGPSLKLLAPGGVCHITLGLTASNSSANDGPIQQNWRIGTRDVQITAYAQAAALSLSAPEIDFGTQYAGGLRLPRYLYLSNNSTTEIEHTAVTLPATSRFTVTDACPDLLEPLTVCQLQLSYSSPTAPSADAVTLSLDQGLTALVTGRTLPQPSTNGASVNPNLSVSSTALNFPTAVPVTSISGATQTLTIQNTGASPFTLALTLTGDFTDSTNCGATLAGGTSCSVVFTFAPSQPGTRQGLLSVTAGAGTTPAYVALTGTGTAILSPANNGTLSFGEVLVGQPIVQWYQVTQPFTSLSVATASTTLGAPFTAVLVEDIGYGHGQPPSSAFSANASGACSNCWLGIQFTAQSSGPELGTLTLNSPGGGSPYVLSLTGTGIHQTGLLLTPVTQDYGPVPVHSASAPTLFAVTNLLASGASINLSTPAVTGDFATSQAATGGAACSGTLAYTASCFLQIAFTPTAEGVRSGTLTVSGGGTTATAALTGYGSPDPGIALNPTALLFNDVPGVASTLQQINITNTGSSIAQINAPSASTIGSSASAFTASTTCGSLAPAATCTIAVTFLPQSAPASGTLSIPVTTSVGGAPVVTTYTVPLTGSYTTEETGLQILPSDAEYGPQATGATGLTRQFTINNLTAKSLALSIALPRQFVLAGSPCSGLAPYASCNFSVSFLPLTNADITGTLYAAGEPTDGTATLNGLGYVEGYGLGTGSLSITGSMQPGGVLNFGQVPSGQSATETLTLTNASATAPLTIRRVTSQWPFLSTTTCGSALAPAASCTVTLTYTPLNQVAAGSSSPVALTSTGTLTIESDSASSPDILDLTGTSSAVTVASPSNTAPLAAFTTSPSSLTFASTPAGAASAPQTVTLSNTGTASVTISGIQTTPDFAVVNGCTILVPGASCTLQVSFIPQSSSTSSTRIAALEIASNASTSLEFVSLIGSADAATLSVAPSSLSFGTVLVGANQTLSLQVDNSGSAAATLTAITATGDYAVANGTCPSAASSLAAGASCALSVTFAPTQAGTRTGTLSISNSATALPLSVPLSGTGIQSHLTITPNSLAFGTVNLGSSASLSLTLSNTGTAPITGIALAITGDYSMTSPCSVTTLAPSASCSVTIAFTPSAAGARSGTLTITSSDPTSPAALPLTGTGYAVPAGSFTLTVSGASSQSVSVASGAAANYSLTVTPINGFTGTVVLNCTPLVVAANTACSLTPSSVMLSGSAQSAVATLNTVISTAHNSPPHTRRNFGETFLCLLFPAAIFTWKARTSSHRAWRVVGPIAWAIFASIALGSSTGCGGSSIKPTGLLYAPAGSYQYQVAASSTGGAVPITQTVTLNLTVQ